MIDTLYASCVTRQGRHFVRAGAAFAMVFWGAGTIVASQGGRAQYEEALAAARAAQLAAGSAQAKTVSVAAAPSAGTAGTSGGGIPPGYAPYSPSGNAGPPPGYMPYPTGTNPGATGTPSMPTAGAARAKVVGTGTIRYSYKASDSTAEPGAVAETPEGKTYVVKTGDCLWNLAGTFLSDPWRWREIWERNHYIANPDLIYPGREIVMSAANAAPPPLDTSNRATPRTFVESTAGFLDDTTGVNRDSIALAERQAEDLALISSIVKRRILTSEFLAASPFLWSTRDARGLLYPGDARIEAAARAPDQTYQQFDEVKIKVFAKGTAYALGDTLDVYRSERIVTYKKRQANLIRRIANARVIEVKRDMLTAVLYRVRDVVKNGDRVARAEKFAHYNVIDYAAPASPLSAAVFERVEQSLFPYPYHSFIIDRGADAGVRVGDLFFAYQAQKPVSPGPTELACAVYVGKDYATCAIVKLFRNTLEPGDRVNLVKRMQTN
jgi:hypothetical protein